MEMTVTQRLWLCTRTAVEQMPAWRTPSVWGLNPKAKSSARVETPDGLFQHSHCIPIDCLFEALDHRSVS